MNIPSEGVEIEWDRGALAVGELLFQVGAPLDNFLRVALPLVMASETMRKYGDQTYPEHLHASCVADNKRLMICSGSEGTVEISATGRNARNVRMTQVGFVAEIEARKWLGHI